MKALMKQAILDHFGGNFTLFYSKYLRGLKRSGKEFQALCPFHSDTNPSLSINPKTGLFKCHACGAGGDIFSFYAKLLSLEDKFPAILKGIGEDFGISNGAKPEPKRSEFWSDWEKHITKTYDYQDESGTLLFQVCRIEPHPNGSEKKPFRQRRPNGKGGWIKGLDDVSPVLHRLPEVLKALEVWIVEGEKDVESMLAIGFAATCNPMGAGKWQDHYSESLTGKNCFIIPDNDTVGKGHAVAVAKSLQGKAASVKILELPNPTSKSYDVSDFIACIGDPETAAERLSIMARGAAEWTPPAEPEQTTETSSRFQFNHNADILAGLQPIEWRIHGILPDYSLYYNFGDPGHFKTFIEIDRLLCIAAGIEYHGHRVKQGTVFFICGEGWQGIGRRIAAWHITHGTRVADVPFFVSQTPTQLMDLEAIQDVRRAVDALAKQYGPPAIVHIDTLARNFGDGDESSNKDMSKAISNLDKAFGNDFCRGVTHHAGHKEKDRARGAMALHGAADAAFRVRLTSSGQVLVECKKMKDASTAPAMLFNRREVLLQTSGIEDRSYVLELTAEGDEALKTVKPKKPRNLSVQMAGAVKLLQKLYAECQRDLAANGRPDGQPHVAFTDWRTACIKAGHYERSDTFNKAAGRMIDKGLIRYDENAVHVYPVGPADSDSRWHDGGE